METPMNDAERNRWFSTGYLAHGVKAVNAEKHTLEDGAVIRVGEARGHRMWIDGEFCKAVATQAQALGDKGLKARFGHPDMCSDALGTFLGRWKDIRHDEDGVVRGNLHLSSTAAESPKGDLRNYIEQMAAKEPDHFGTSIVFSRDWDAEDEFMAANTKEVDETDETGNPTGRKLRRFQSPDPANTSNLRHARLSALHAADLVDDPAATDGMFSGVGGMELAARVSEWLDTHPEILKAFSEEPDMVAIIERYATELRPFVERYTANHPTAAAESVKDSELAAESAGKALAQEKDRVTALSAERDDLAVKLQSSLAKHDADVAALAKVQAERDELAAKLAEAVSALADAKTKLDALTAGASPVSAEPAPAGEQLTPWQKAQRSARRK